MATTTINVNTAITNGVTPINSGTSGRILFQNSANKVGQNSGLFFDEANERLSLGQGSSPGARLDVRLPGVLSSDLGARWRNFANTRNLFRITGTGAHFDVDGGSAFDSVFSIARNGSVLFSVDEYAMRFNGASFFTSLAAYGSGPILVNPQSGGGGRLSLSPHSGAVGFIAAGVGPVAPPSPTTSSTVVWAYPTVVGGVLVNTFKNGNGDVIKLFKSTALTVSDGTLANAVTRIAELEARLQSTGLLS